MSDSRHIGILKDGHNVIGERVVVLVAYNKIVIQPEWVAELPGKYRVEYSRGWSNLFNVTYHAVKITWRDQSGQPPARLRLPEDTMTVKEYLGMLSAECPDKGLRGKIRGVIRQARGEGEKSPGNLMGQE